MTAGWIPILVSVSAFPRRSCQRGRASPRRSVRCCRCCICTDCRPVTSVRRWMTAPVLAVGDGALGFRKALREVFPATREQRCWFHKQANVLAVLPKSAHPGALAAIKDIYNAEDIDHAQLAIKAFEIDYGA